MTGNSKSRSGQTDHLIPFELNEKHKVPIYKQLADGLRESILSFQLMPGQLLPSTRELSDSLGISRTTVLRSYEELLSQGYLKSVDGIGTFISEKIPLAVASDNEVLVNASLRLSRYADQIMSRKATRQTSADWQELNFGATPAHLLPIKSWRQVLLKSCRTYDIDKEDYEIAPFGYAPLREVIANYLCRARAVRCSPEQLAVYSGSLYGVNLIARLFLDAGDYVAVENPGFPYAREAFLAQGAKLCPIPVDQDGIIVDELKKLESRCRLVYLTPSHQDPTGAVLSLNRRRQLLAWAKKTGTIIVEDDYDGEYRYSGAQLPSLQGLDDGDLVIFVSSFWRTLFPLVNVGYLVMPRALIPVAYQAQLVRDNALNTVLPALEHRTLTEFINEGFFERYIRKTHAVHASRSRALTAALTRQLKDVAVWPKECAAVHLLVRFDEQFTSEHILQCASDSKLSIVSTDAYYINDPPQRQYMIPFAHTDADLLQRRVENFARLLLNRQHLGHR